MKIKVAAIIEARMLSNRLPGKVLKKITNNGKYIQTCMWINPVQVYHLFYW